MWLYYVKIALQPHRTQALRMIVKSQTFRFGSNFILKIQNLDLAHETNDNDRIFGFEQLDLIRLHSHNLRIEHLTRLNESYVCFLFHSQITYASDMPIIIIMYFEGFFAYHSTHTFSTRIICHKDSFERRNVVIRNHL